jgi:hypothetical protein
VRHETRCRRPGRGASLRLGVGGEPGGGEAEQNRGAGSASRLAVRGEVAGGCE